MTSAYAIGFENYVPGDGGIAESMIRRVGRFFNPDFLTDMYTRPGL